MSASRMCAELPEAVLFDLDGTLIDGEAAWAVAHYEVAARLGGRLSETQLAELSGVSLDVSVAAVMGAAGWGPSDQLAAMVREQLLDRVCELYQQGVEWLPGAVEAVDLVSSAGLPMALVTNTSRRLVHAALGGAGVLGFRTMVCGDDVVDGKPSPEGYLLAAQRLGVPIERCVAVEDSLSGVIAVQRSGARLLAVPGREDLLGLTLADLAVTAPLAYRERA